MPQIINTNIASINAQRNLDKSQGDNQTALQRLSSGLRINSAKDDAAGLAISTRFTAQIQGLTVAIRNAGDGVSLAQTAEGALGAMTENLLRIRDLALQAANATNSDIDRAALNEEVEQLKAEIDRVSQQTTFNGTKLLDGTFQDVTFQIGANEGETVSFGIAGTTIDKLGTAPTDGISSDPQDGVDAAALAAGDLVINGIAIGASSGVDDAFSSNDQDQSAIAKAAAINKVSDLTNVTATVNGTFVGGTSYTNATNAGNITVNGITINVSTNTNLAETTNLENVVSSINQVSGQTGVTASFGGNPAQGIQLTAEDGRNIILADGTGNTEDYGLTVDGTYTGSFTLVSDDGTNITLDSNTGNIENAGLAIGEFSGTNSGVISEEVAASDMAAGDLVVNGVPIGPALSTFDTATVNNPQQSAIAKAAAINEVSEQTGVTAIVNSTVYNGTSIPAVASGAGSGSFEINGVQINISWGATDTQTDRQNAVVSAINGKAGQSGVRAEAFADTFRLIAEDGRNIEIDTYTTLADPLPADIGLPLAAGIPAVQSSSITLVSAGQITLETLTGNISNSGFEVGTYGSGSNGTLVQDIDISTVEGAIAALDAVDNALNIINFQRANLGAIQNRFESTIETQQITAENLGASNSRIKDADFAAETAELSRTQVLQQAGLSVLSQANAQPESVLQLLQ